MIDENPMDASMLVAGSGEAADQALAAESTAAATGDDGTSRVNAATRRALRNVSQKSMSATTRRALSEDTTALAGFDATRLDQATCQQLAKFLRIPGGRVGDDEAPQIRKLHRFLVCAYVVGTDAVRRRAKPKPTGPSIHAVVSGKWWWRQTRFRRSRATLRAT